MPLKSKNQKVIASLLVMLLSLPLVVQGTEKRVLASASYKDVCNKMFATGMIRRRAQTTRALDSFSDNITVFVGINGFPQARESRLVSNSEIFVGLNGTAVTTHTSSSVGYSAGQADPCGFVGETRVTERPIFRSLQRPIANHQ